MAEAAITFLVEKMKDVQKWHKKLISGSEDEFDMLSKDLLLLRAFFKDATNHLKMTEMLRTETERRIREVVYGIEDAIDTRLLRAEAKSKSTIRRHLDLNRFSLAKEVRWLRIYKLQPMFERVKEDFLHLGIAQGAATTTEEPLLRLIKSESIWQEKFIGFKDEEARLISNLMEQTKELGVIAIYGIDGSGKTTLARKIFEDEAICLEFPTRIWIPVSRRFNSRDVFLKILERFTSDDMSNLSDHELARAVHLCLAEEKFLLVIDDLCSSDNWNAVKNALPDSNALGKVLITTQSLSMATDASVGRGGEPFMLRSLSNEESWELLELEVYGKLKDCTPELRGVGEKIAQVCHGLPLAVVVIGGILEDMFMKTGPTPVLKKKWETMSEIEKEYYRSQVVELSYDRLSGYLKECFLYLAVFPEDQHTIPARTLMQLWIVEGFIPPKAGKMLEETAEEYLDELTGRNLLMVDRVNPLGKTKTCRVHNVIREFARSKALEHDLFHEITTPNERVVEEVNRVCLHSELTKFLSEKPNGTRVRSLFCFYREPVHLDPKRVSTVPDALSSLRVLDSKHIKFTQFPAWVTKLIHLRYITLNIDALTIIPEPISQLWNLETLVVETKSRSITMKANIWRMYRMRHLQTKAAIVLDGAKWEGKAGGNLQTVSRLSPESCTADVSERASNLKTLAIRGKLATFFNNVDFLPKMNRLEKLELVNDDLSHVKPLNGLPRPSYFPPNLKRLTLSNTFLKWKHMSSLAKIETLEVLKLKENVFTGIYWSAVDDRFPNLKFLLIANTDLVHWEASTNSFPKLEWLVINKCENLNEIPGVLAKYLTKLDIERVGKSAVDSARRIAELKANSGFPFKLSIRPRF